MNEVVHPYWVLFDIFILNLANCTLPFIVRGRRYLRANLYSKTNTKILFFLCLIFWMFAMWDGDWGHYQRWFYNYYKEYQGETHIEYIYCQLRENIIIESYFLFRLIIWGGALYLFRRALIRLEAYNNLIYIVFTVISMLPLTATRGTLGLSLLFLGYTYLIKPNPSNKKLSIVWGLSLMVLALIFHKTIYIALAISIISFIPFKKLEFYLSLAVFPIISAFLIGYTTEINEIMQMGGSIDFAGSSYLGVEGTETGIAMTIYYIFSFIPILVVIVTTIWKLLYKRELNKEEEIKKVFHWCYISVYIYLICIQIPFGSEYLAPRFLQMLYLPFCYLVYLLFSKGYLSAKILYFTIILGILTNNWRLLYSLYLQI